MIVIIIVINNNNNNNNKTFFIEGSKQYLDRDNLHITLKKIKIK